MSIGRGLLAAASSLGGYFLVTHQSTVTQAFCDAASEVDIYEKFLKPWSSTSSMLNCSYPKDLDLQLVQVVVRHGDRSPIHKRLKDSFPTEFNVCSLKAKEQLWQSSLEGPPLEYTRTYLNEHGEAKPQQCYFGQLTTRGQRHMESAGRLFRQLYVDQLGFLPRRLLATNEMYVRSTDFPRTIQSAEAFLTGMYPARYRVPEHPIEIHLHREANDTLHPNTDQRRLLRDLRHKYRESAECLKVFEEAEPHLNMLREQCKEPKMSYHAFYDEILCRTAHRLPIPDGVTTDMLEALEKAAVHQFFGFMFNDRKACGIVIGRFVKDLWEGIQDRVRRGGSKKIELYAAHDTTITPLLCALGVFDGHWPRYGATLVLETFAGPRPEPREDGVEQPRPLYVRVIYDQVPLKLPGSDSEFCDMDTFEKLVHELIPTGGERKVSEVLGEEGALR